ncbi:MAG: protoglobin domain-containing protein [Pseudolabrys sp.]
MIAQLLSFIEITEETERQGPDIWRLLEPRADAILAAFYTKVQGFHVNHKVTDATIAPLIAKQKLHWAALFGSRFDEDYANSVRRIGIRHREINLELTWYVLGYEALKIAFTEAIIDSALPPIQKGRLVKTLGKYIAFDVALALSTYEAAVLD